MGRLVQLPALKTAGLDDTAEATINATETCAGITTYPVARAVDLRRIGHHGECGVVERKGSRICNSQRCQDTFLQDEPTTDPSCFNYVIIPLREIHRHGATDIRLATIQVESNFGLMPRSYDSDSEFDPEGQKTAMGALHVPNQQAE